MRTEIVGQSPTKCELRISESVHAEYMRFCRESGIAHKYAGDPRYLLVHVAGHFFQKLFEEDEAEEILVVLNNVVRDYEGYKDRDNGVPYVNHVVDAALKGQQLAIHNALGFLESEQSFTDILRANLNVDVSRRFAVTSTIADLLHDHIENLEFTRDQIAQMYGESVAEIVEGYSKLNSDYWSGMSAGQLDAKLRYIQLSSLASTPEIILQKVLSDFRSNAATLQYLKAKGEKSAEQRAQSIAQGYLERFGDFILERHLTECYEALDQCLRYAFPGEYQRLHELREKHADEVSGLKTKFDRMWDSGLAQAGIDLRLYHQRFHVPSVYEMYMRQCEGIADPRLLCSPCVYIECSTYGDVGVIADRLKRFDFAEEDFKYRPTGNVVPGEDHDSMRIHVLNGNTITPTFVLFTHKKAHLFEPSRYLIQEYKNGREAEFAHRVRERSRVYFGSFAEDMPDELRIRRIQEEAGWNLIEVHINEDTVLIPAGGTAFDAYARYYATRYGLLGDVRVPSSRRTYRALDGERRGGTISGLTAVLQEGDKLYPDVEAPFSVYPTVQLYQSVKSLEARITLYAMAARVTHYYKDNEDCPLLVNECRAVMLLAEVQYGSVLTDLVSRS